MARLDGVGERLLIDELAARGVHDPDTLLHPGEPVRVDQVPGFRQRRHVQGNDVGLRNQLVEIDERHAGGVGGARREERVVGQDVHVECPGPRRYFAADAPESDHAELAAA